MFRSLSRCPNAEGQVERAGASRSKIGGSLFVALLLCAWGTPALAQLPITKLNSIFPLGGTAGSTVEVKIAGTDLEDVTALTFSHPGITAKLKTREPKLFEEGPQPIDNTFEISVDSKVPVGTYDVRASGRFGLSNARAFMVGRHPDIVETEPNDSIDKPNEVTIPAAISGLSNKATDQDFFTFEAKKGERLIIDCWAERIDSQLDASLTLYDGKGNELDSSRDVNRRDPMIDFTVPADGTYILRVFDFVYAGGADYFYRVVISADPYIDFVYPPSGQPGSKGQYTVYGRNLPNGKPSEFYVGGKQLQQIQAPITLPDGQQARQLDVSAMVTPGDVDLDAVEFRLEGSNPAIIGIAAAPIVLEKEPTDEKNPQQVSLPCEYVGCFQKQGDVDFVQFAPTKGDIFWFEVISQRHGLPTDPYMLVQRVVTDAEGKVTISDVKEVDDAGANIGGLAFNTTCDDPSYRFAAPADGVYRVLVRDLYSRGDPRYLYRLSMHKESPDFRLVAMPVFPGAANVVDIWSPVLRPGGTQMIEVLALRRDGFKEDIEIRMEGLPADVACSTITIPGNQNAGTLILHAGEKAKAWNGIVSVWGKSTVEGETLERQARAGQALWKNAQNATAPARVMRELSVAVIDVEPAPLTVELGAGQDWETCKAGILEIPIKVTRREGAADAVGLAAVGLSKIMKVPNVNLKNTETESKVKVTIPNNYPAGKYSIMLLATSSTNYERNKQLVELAKEEQSKFAEVVKTTAEEVKQATAAKTEADKAAAAAAAAAKKTPDDKALATAAEEATKAATEAAAALKASQDKAKAAADYKKVVDKNVTDRTNAAKAKKTALIVGSTSVTITVTDAPIKLEQPKAVSVKQGEAAKLPVAIQRLYEFADQVTLDVTVPGAAKGLTVAKGTIAKGKNDGVHELNAAATTPAGEHELTIQATAKLNNTNLQVTETVKVQVVEVAKAEAAK